MSRPKKYVPLWEHGLLEPDLSLRVRGYMEGLSRQSAQRFLDHGSVDRALLTADEDISIRFQGLASHARSNIVEFVRRNLPTKERVMSRVRERVTVRQISRDPPGYAVLKLINTTEPAIGQVLSKAAVEDLIRRDVEVTVVSK